MPTLFDSAARAGLLARLDLLTAETERQWGTMTSPQMVKHCAESLRMALGDITPKPKNSRMLSNRLMRHLIIHVLPFPRGAPTARELQPQIEQCDFDVDRQALRELFDRIGRCVPEGPWPKHPAFGDITGSDWGVLGWRHIDHHFRQFGV